MYAFCVFFNFYAPHFYGLEEIGSAYTRYKEFKLSRKHAHVVFYDKGKSDLSVFCANTIKYCYTLDMKERIVDINVCQNIIVVTSSCYIRGVNIYTGNTELFMYVKNANSAHLLRNNKVLVEYDDKVVLYSVYNQVEHTYNYEKYKLLDSYILLMQSGQVTIFDHNFSVVREYNINMHKYFDFTLYKGRLVHMIDNKIIGKSYNIDLTPYFDTTFEDLYITKRYVYMVNDNKIYLYDKKGNKNKPMFLYASANAIEAYKRTKHKLIGTINNGKKGNLDYIMFDSYHLCDQVLAVLYKDKLLYYQELDERYEKYIEIDECYEYKQSENDFETTSSQ